MALLVYDIRIGILSRMKNVDTVKASFLRAII